MKKILSILICVLFVNGIAYAADTYTVTVKATALPNVGTVSLQGGEWKYGGISWKYGSQTAFSNPQTTTTKEYKTAVKEYPAKVKLWAKATDSDAYYFVGWSMENNVNTTVFEGYSQEAQEFTTPWQGSNGKTVNYYAIFKHYVYGDHSFFL